MTTPPRNTVLALSLLGRWLFASAFWMIGLVVLALAVGRPAVATGHIEAPRWVLGAAGMLFVAGGFAPIAAHLAADSWAARCFGLAVLLPLALIFNWVAFGPGDRHFSGGLSIAGFKFPGAEPAQSTGRMTFGIAAIAIDLMVVAVIIRWARRTKS